MEALEPIGYFRGAAEWKFDAPRQGVFDGVRGVVELLPRHNFEQALRDLEGFGRIWLIFLFNRNGGKWRPTTRPPVPAPGRERIGTFASRSPYRPNPIGLSCVRLLGVRGLSVEVAEADLLDGTPILDIKPYIPAADSFPDAAAGWVDAQDADAWTVAAGDEFEALAARVLALGGPDLESTARVQLSHAPFDDSRKRVERTPEGGTLSLRMFRVDFAADETARAVTLIRIRSGYTPAELADSADPYRDKPLHRAFLG